MNEQIEKLRKMIDDSDNIVFFGGAGVSTESGIPDFRSADGLYNRSSGTRYSPEQLISHTFYVRHPEMFYKFYRDNMVITDVEPNPAHYALAELEKQGKLKAVITQNIDGLHQKAGSKNVFELHGSIHRNYCVKCKKFYDAEYVKNYPETVPLCECGGMIKPDVVLYEESLPQDQLEGAIKAISRAKLLIVGGTSLVVYPAAGLLEYFTGDGLVLINKSATSYDGSADLIIREPIGETLKKAVLE